MMAAGRYRPSVRVGLVLPQRSPDGGPLRRGDLARGAARIEAHGFASAWAFDAVGRGFLLPDALTALAVAATATATIELGTGVLQLPLRPPFEVAQRVATAQHVIGDRFLLGVGAGSTEDDFTVTGTVHAERFRTFGRHLDTLQRLLDGDDVDGRRLGIWDDVRGGPPILIGSWVGSRWIERAARDHDGWIGSGARTSWALLTDGIRRFRAAGGRRAIITNVVVDLDEDNHRPGADDPVDLRCSPAEAARRLGSLAELGFDDTVLVLGRHTDAALAQLADVVREAS